MIPKSRPIPEALVPLQQQFEQFRATHPPRSKLPDEFWASAAGLAKQHGLYTVAHALRLDYMGLKKRVVGSARPRRKPPQPRFVELIGPGSPQLDECIIEFESARGAKMRHPMEGRCAAGLGRPAARLAPGGGMIQITAQMRILVAIEPVDGRKGIDSLARLCQEKLAEDPFSGCVFVFRSRSGTAIRLLTYDGQGYWLAQKRLSRGRFVWWPESDRPAKPLEAYEAQVLMAAGDVSRVRAAPMWRRVGVLKA